MATGHSKPSSLERAIISLAQERPELGQVKVADELSRRGHSVSPSGVRHIWKRHGLETTYKRIKALQRDGDGTNALTPSQRSVLERGDRRRRVARRGRTLDMDGGPGDRRLQILEAAAVCFTERGYAQTSLRDIAGMIGLLPGSIYHHFRTKQELFLSLHHEGFDQLINGVKAVIAQTDEPWLRFELACAEHIKALVTGNAILRLTGSTFFSSYDAKLAQRLKPDRNRYDALFKELVDALPLRPEVDRSLFRLFVLGAVNWPHVWYRPGKQTPADIAHQLILVLRHSAV